MFARPRPKKSALGGPPPKKRKASHAVQEIKFDPDARNEYLTGFHKRKVQRTKRAQEEAAKRARQEKVEMRKQLREERKKEVEEHVQNVTAILKEAARAGYIDEEEVMSGGDGEDGEREGGAGGEWDGFEDAPAADNRLDHEEEYVDDDRFTTVTVESVNVSRDGLVKPDEDDDEQEDDHDQEGGRGDRARHEGKSTTRSGSSRGKHDTREPKKKKPKFRYETKTERLQEQRRQKARKKRKAAP